MKRIFLFLIVLLASVLMAGCGTSNDPVSNNQTGSDSLSVDDTNSGENSADFQGVILELGKSSITVGTDDVDPEASYPAYEVFIDNQTDIEGNVNKFSRLKAEQNVEIWVKGKWNNNPENQMIATKIIVGKE
ncbi:hypothetical protein [Lentibacillus sp. CBA3610]|uniref:hypothetical protein n=1 Tax=Lentibacillus sp. CBA3610 TaxID=2518176 RepID=UPI001595BE60|nr:hypothetical protein [Lentibacillus sp. CBA3610]QKY69401.1 hypothetical protein Len3610_07155 [Lentibacillus sp. CBA3610]